MRDRAVPYMWVQRYGHTGAFPGLLGTNAIFRDRALVGLQ